MIGDKHLRGWYLSYNRRYFHEELPLALPVVFGACPKDSLGVTYFDEGVATEIVLNRWLKGSSRVCKTILIHEMCHVAVGNKERHLHGPLWRKERKRLIDAGAFTCLL